MISFSNGHQKAHVSKLENAKRIASATISGGSNGPDPSIRLVEPLNPRAVVLDDKI